MIPSPSSTVTPRDLLLEFYQLALTAVAGDGAVRGALGEDPAPERFRHLLAVGKAAAAMTRGALEVLGDRFRDALVVTKHGHGDPGLAADPRVYQLEAGHPVPDAASLAAGAAVLEYLEALPPGEPLLVLLSGGASAVLEAPAPGVDGELLLAANRWLLGSGLPIHPVNRVRRGLSRLKGGRMAATLGGRETLVLAVSDVPGDRLESIGSGPLVAAVDPPGWDDLDLPPWLRAALDHAPPPPDPAAFQAIRHRLVASNRTARAAVAAAARNRGLPVTVHEVLLEGDAATSGARVVADPRPGLQIWGGETTVRLPPVPGRGGRCQHLALAAALALDGRRDCWCLAAGTDGSDGPGEDAGALVDGDTVTRGRDAGRDPRVDLAAADAGTFLAASGDLVSTGPTGTNVMDLVLVFSAP